MRANVRSVNSKWVSRVESVKSWAVVSHAKKSKQPGEEFLLLLFLVNERFSLETGMNC